MTAVLEWIASPAGRTACAASALTVAGLMIVMSFLHWKLNRRHGAYRLLIAGLLLTPAIYADLPGAAWSAVLSAASLISFVIINFAVLALYATLRKGDIALLAAIAVIAAGVAFLQFGLETGWLTGSGQAAADSLPEAGEAHTPFVRPVDLTFLIVSGLLPAYILPRVGQQARVASAQAAYFLSRITVIAAGGAGSLPLWIAAAGRLFETAYFYILFFILFRRTLERMQSVYMSSIRDGLTGLYNRRHFLKKANRYIGLGLPVSIVFCDIDNFKRLNDTRGHHAADEALKQVASILSDEVARNGAAGRYGGEELVAAVARPGADPAAIAEKIRRRVEQETIVTVSVGVCPAGTAGSIEEAMRLADEAMYASKTTGKNKVTVHKADSEAAPVSAAAAAGRRK